jgi:RND family efflux transporter MFP subunit
MRREWLYPGLLSCLAVAGCVRSQATPPPPPLPEVKVSLPTSREVTDYEDFPGRLEAVNAVDLRARVTGYLDKVKFKEGAFVAKGDVLFEIDDRTYQAELARADGNVVQNEGNLKRLDYEYDRAALLLPRGAIGREEYDKAAGDRTMAVGALAVAKANLVLAKQNVSWTKVKAPLSGKISRRYLDPGNLVKADDTVLTSIVSLDPIYAYFDLDERTTLRLQKLIRDGKLSWSLDGKLPVLLGLADEEGYPLKGAIDFADNKVDADTGTWRLRALVHNADLGLAPGYFVRVRLPIGIPHRAILVSEQALGTDQGQKFVYVVEKMAAKVIDGKSVPVGEVAYRRVKVGRLHDGLRVISEGLKADERVIVSGLQRARPGATVRLDELDHMPVVSDK